MKEELKRYKQSGPDTLKKEKLFEIKFHGLPQKKKRELETTLREFAASLQSSPDNSSSQTKKSSRRVTHDHGYSGSGSLSKHASSSSGSHVRPADSAYASMSTGAKSSGTSLTRPMMMSKHANEKKIENYLRDIPEGLYPRHMAMTDKDRKKLVVRRLEQLFTGKLGGRRSKQKQLAQDTQPELQEGKLPSLPASVNVVAQPAHVGPPPRSSLEPSREAKILPLEQQSGHSRKKSRSRDNGSSGNSHGDGTESGGAGKMAGPGGQNPSPPMPPPPEQRPTRPRDLDPDRVQIPSENMKYIRHLGLGQPGVQDVQPADDVQPDEEGWVYLNLLCNLAQLHIINVTPAFVRSAVSERSTKFQLSADGQKIRWRGGTDGTKFSSDSSGYNSSRGQSTDESDNSKKQSHKRRRTGRSSGQSGGSSKNPSKFGLNPSPSESFHYKPLFARRESSTGETSLGETLSSFGPAEESNVEDSRWDMSGSGTSNRRKRRHDGAVIYYSGAPFCTDLSGDTGDISSPSHMLSSTMNTDVSSDMMESRIPQRTNSGSFPDCRPLSDQGHFLMADSTMDIDDEVPSLTADDTDQSSDVELDLVWSDKKQFIELHTLEPSGLGGVLPEDHFVVVVTTKRPKQDVVLSKRPPHNPKVEESTDSIIRRLATMSTSSPVLRPVKHVPRTEAKPFGIDYVSGAIKRLAPVPLPPPALFYSVSTEYSTTDDLGVSEDAVGTSSSEELMSRCANPHQSDDYPDGVDLSSGDEEGDDPEEYPVDDNMYDIDGGDSCQPLASQERISPPRRTSSAAAAAGTAGGGSKTSADRMLSGDDSSAATAGGAESGYSSDE